MERKIVDRFLHFVASRGFIIKYLLMFRDTRDDDFLRQEGEWGGSCSGGFLGKVRRKSQDVYWGHVLWRLEEDRKVVGACLVVLPGVGADISPRNAAHDRITRPGIVYRIEVSARRLSAEKRHNYPRLFVDTPPAASEVPPCCLWLRRHQEKQELHRYWVK